MYHLDLVVPIRHTFIFLYMMRGGGGTHSKTTFAPALQLLLRQLKAVAAIPQLTRTPRKKIGNTGKLLGLALLGLLLDLLGGRPLLQNLVNPGRQAQG